MKTTVKQQRAGFTLVEIMIVVAIIGLLAAIAIPNFVKARGTAQTNACIQNLRVLDGAKEQWALENRKAGTATPTKEELTPFLRSWPTCPGGGADYIGTIGNLQTAPACSIGAPHALD
jgi:prepilin-type N-terminal cleavage/methylation domain-containing protein